MGWQEAVETTVTGMGYDLVEVQRTAGGLLRITIDLPFTKGQPAGAVTVEDCEAVTRQLQFLLEVEAVDYKRLEVGSPGIDRLLRHEADLERFEGELIDVTLKEPLGAEMGVYANRKKFRGHLEKAAAAEGWQVVWTEAPQRKPGAIVSKHAKPLPVQALQFLWSEVREARLADVVDFKGRQAVPQEQSDDGISASGDDALNVE
jgi:ribosome maturation factor RimP